MRLLIFVDLKERYVMFNLKYGLHDNIYFQIYDCVLSSPFPIKCACCFNSTIFLLYVRDGNTILVVTERVVHFCVNFGSTKPNVHAKVYDGPRDNAPCKILLKSSLLQPAELLVLVARTCSQASRVLGHGFDFCLG